MSIKTEKTLLEFKVDSPERGMVKLSIDTSLSIAQFQISTNETQATIPVSILSLPELAEFFMAVATDEQVLELVDALTPDDELIDQEDDSQAPEEG